MNLSPAVMLMRQPHACPVRRNFLSGIQVEFKRSLHQRSLRAQLHWLQVTIDTPGHTLGLNLTLLLDSNTGLLVTGGQPVARCGFPHHLPSSPSTKVHRSGLRFVLLFPLSLKLTAESLTVSSTSSEPRPFIDVSVITRFNQHSNVTQIK